MPEMINVEEARAYAQKRWPSPVVRRPIEALLDDCPRAEVESVRHGRWMPIEGFLACSECGASPADWEAKPNNPLGMPPFCHSCGAKMDAKEDDNDL